MRNRSVLGILFISISILIGCNTQKINHNNQNMNIASNEDVTKNKSSKENTLPISDTSGKLVNEYKTIDEINKDSELVVMGTIVNNEYIEYGGLTFTLSKFKINKVIKGNVNAGDVIKVLQNGGISEFKSNEADVKSFEDPEEVKKNLEENAGKKYEITINDVKVLKENDNAVLLLQRYDGPIATDSYIGTGDFQGRFIVDEKTKSINPQSKLLKENVTFDKIMSLK